MFQTNDKLICNKTVVKRDFTGPTLLRMACFVPFQYRFFFPFVGAEVNFGGLRRPKLSSTLCGLSATRSFRVVYVHTPARQHNGKMRKIARSRFSTICHTACLRNSEGNGKTLHVRIIFLVLRQDLPPNYRIENLKSRCRLFFIMNTQST